MSLASDTCMALQSGAGVMLTLLARACAVVQDTEFPGSLVMAYAAGPECGEKRTMMAQTEHPMRMQTLQPSQGHLLSSEGLSLSLRSRQQKS